MVNIFCVLVLGFIFQGNDCRPQIVLDYKPTKLPYYPRPGHLSIQLVPPGKPWPARPEDYANFSQTSPPLNLEDRFKETTPSSISGRPPFHPNPGNNVGQIVPPGNRWPANWQGYANFSQTSLSPNLENEIQETTPSIQSGRPPVHPNPGSNVASLIPPDEPRPTKPENQVNFSQTTESTSLDNRDEVITPLYQPGRPSFHPNPGNNVAQIVPPGKPWPARPEDYANFSQTSPSTNVEDRFKETTRTNMPVESNPAKPQNNVNITEITGSSSLENTDEVITPVYQPGRPPFHPNPGNNVAQIVPPGKPWPSRPEDYANFSQTSPATNFDDRFKETTPLSISELSPLHPNPEKPQDNVNFSQITESPNLENRDEVITPLYQPGRPPFHPNPGNNIAPIVPPGKPWPANPEGYSNISQTSKPPYSEDRNQTATTLSQAERPAKLENKNPMIDDEKDRIVFPKDRAALKWKKIGRNLIHKKSRISKRALKGLYTSSATQSTISDQNDIILEQAHISLVNNRNVNASNLLPPDFNIDNLKPANGQRRKPPGHNQANFSPHNYPYYRKTSVQQVRYY